MNMKLGFKILKIKTKTGFKLKGTEKLECEVTIKGGKVLYDLNGLANPIYVK